MKKIYQRINAGEDQLKAAYDSTVAITNYAQAAITAVPKIANPPSWFRSTQDHINAAQTHAGTWLKNICPALTAAVPCAIVNFSRKFDTVSSTLLEILQSIESQSGGIPTDDQRRQADGLFAVLIKEVQQNIEAVQSVRQQLSDFFGQLVNDHTVLSEDINEAQEKFTEGKKWVQDLEADIGEDYLNSQTLGPCHSIVEIEMNITIKVQQSGADPAIITLVFTVAILKNQLANQTEIIPAIQNVLDFWVALEEKLNSVASDLKNAQGEDYTNILKQIDLQVAREQWGQAADYAEDLYGKICSPT